VVDTYEGRKPTASWRRPPGRPQDVWLNKVQEDANALPLSTPWRLEIARGHGPAQRFIHSDDDDDDDCGGGGDDCGGDYGDDGGGDDDDDDDGDVKLDTTTQQEGV